jgi:hypothetical protein
MDAEGHPVSFQNITSLPVKPAGIAKLEGIPELLGKHFTEYIQPPAVEWKTRRTTKEDRAELRTHSSSSSIWVM